MYGRLNKALPVEDVRASKETSSKDGIQHNLCLKEWLDCCSYCLLILGVSDNTEHDKKGMQTSKNEIIKG